MALLQEVRVEADVGGPVGLVRHLELPDVLPVLGGPVVDAGVEVSPRGELPVPVGDGGEGGHDEEGPPQGPARWRGC